jgi:hypothetical protein
MNEANYRMDYEDRKQYVVDRLTEYLEDDDDAFIEAVDELIRYNGFIDVEAFPMDEIDEICGDMKPSDLIEKMTSDFDSNDDYFYFSIYGLESCNDKAELYRDETTVEDVVDGLIDYGYQLSFCDGTLSELVDVLANEDFGIDYDWEYDEDMDEDDEPEETDDEFKDRIDAM